MTDFIRKLCDTEISGINAQHKLSEDEERFITEKEDIKNILRKQLCKEDFALIEEFISIYDFALHDAECHAFSCGIKFALRIAFGVFSDG